VHHHTRALAIRLTGHGVTVNAIAPSPFKAFDNAIRADMAIGGSTRPSPRRRG